jgi:hypothetical protein
MPQDADLEITVVREIGPTYSVSAIRNSLCFLVNVMLCEGRNFLDLIC